MTMLDPSGFELPPIPTKRYFTIGEVSTLCEVKPHVLRYWEQEFSQLTPVKRRGNRRYYQRHEVKLIRHIRKLLYVEGFTIGGARIRLEQLTSENEITTTTSSPTVANQDTSKMVSLLIAELTEVREILD